MNKDLQRSFILGDNWLYYKIYTGPKTSDVVLTKIIKPVSEGLINDKIIDRWFFIRYGDPKHHIRVRFHFTKPENVGIIINTFFMCFNKFANQDLIWNLQTDVYQREIERYGVNTMVLSEELFHYDSKMIVSFINLIEGSDGEELRWLFSLKAVDSLLNSFKYTDEGKMNLLIDLSTQYRNEFESSKILNKQLNNKFREERKRIETFLTTIDDNQDYTPILDLLKEKEKNINNIVFEILKIEEEGKLHVPLNGLMSSYIHMLMNRIFKSKNRIHEMVCYDFLCRYYKSVIAKKKFLFS